MNATDELNAEIGGEEHEYVDCGVCKFYHADIQFCQYGIPPCPKFERKVELTGKTCEDVSTKNGIFECSKCGCTVKEDGVDWGEIHYCPDCGKAVKR